MIILGTVGCGTSKNSVSSGDAPVAGNWQFSMAAPSDKSFSGTSSPSCAPASSSDPVPVCLGGFLQQNGSAVNGQVTYSITPASLPTGGFACSGSASVNGSVSGQNINLAVQAGAQTFSLTGSLSADGTTMMGTYSSVATQSCGRAQSGLQWRAVLVPSFSGPVQGFLHSSAPHNFSFAFPTDQDFPITGVLTQGPNTGASSATVTGTLNIQAYPCFSGPASVNGEISGSSAVLQVIAGNGLNVGQIGALANSVQSTPSPILIQNATTGLMLSGVNGYGMSSKKCPLSSLPGDYGNVCLAIGNSTSCTQPVLLSPATLTFPPQLVGSQPTSQTITLSNNDPSGAPLSGVSLSFNPLPQGVTPAFQNTLSDFSGLPNFTEQDNCTSSPGAPFTLGANQSCSITITFTPQESCPWIPFSSSSNPTQAGAAPGACPLPLSATLTVNSPNKSADKISAFTVPVSGTGLSAIVPSNFEMDFGAEALSEISAPQTLTLTNQSNAPVFVLPALSQPCQIGPSVNPPYQLPRPAIAGGVPGLQVIAQGGKADPLTPLPASQSGNYNTVTYNCDSDPTSHKPNFQISSDNCSGATLNSQQSCSLAISFAPQPGTPLNAGLDYFLELNTLQCTGSTTVDCEVDSGRFPVELKANIASPLRMSPGAGLDFSLQSVGQTSGPLTITLFNDPKDANAGTVNFTGNIVKGNYAETDNCSSLAPGSSCTITVTFTPQSTGLNQGTVTIGYAIGNSFGQTQTIYLRGTGQ